MRPSCWRRPSAVIETRFWREEDGLSVDVLNEQWTELEPYRGANANMHLVEAFLVTADVTGETIWRTRALSIAERLIHGHARAHEWRLPEHYDEQWQPLLEYNRDLPAHPFRPFGSTVGHWMEWARLLGQLHQALEQPPAWLLDDAAALFDAAVAQGWAVDGADGFVYTVDFAGRPVVTARMHWVVAEAIGAAAMLSAITGEPRYGEWLGTWWRYAGPSCRHRARQLACRTRTRQPAARGDLERQTRHLSRLPSGAADVAAAGRQCACRGPPARSRDLRRIEQSQRLIQHQRRGLRRRLQRGPAVGDPQQGHGPVERRRRRI